LCIALALALAALIVNGGSAPVPELEQMHMKYDAEVQEKAEQPFTAAVLKLNQSYSATLEKELLSAQRAGKLNNVLEIQTEKALAEKAEPIPPQNDAEIPGGVKALRASYNVSLSLLVSERNKRFQPITSAYSKSLAVLVTSLTKAGRIEDAKLVEERRAAIEVKAECRKFEGTWDVLYRSVGTSRRYRFNSVGKVEWLEGGRVKAATDVFKKGSDLMLDWNDGKFERVSSKGDKLIVEHFNPGTRYPKAGPNTVGTGEKLK
jgi:hypothetical protein